MKLSQDNNPDLNKPEHSLKTQVEHFWHSLRFKGKKNGDDDMNFMYFALW